MKIQVKPEAEKKLDRVIHGLWIMKFLNFLEVFVRGPVLILSIGKMSFWLLDISIQSRELVGAF
jgi:hypothetical protein